jgi:hypothetical protein
MIDSTLLSCWWTMIVIRHTPNSFLIKNDYVFRKKNILVLL